MALTMVRMDEARPPGVSSRTMTSFASLFSADSIPRVRKAAVPGLIEPSSSRMTASPCSPDPHRDPEQEKGREAARMQP